MVKQFLIACGVLVLLMSTTSFAKSKVAYTHDFTEPGVGTLRVQVVDREDPIQLPYVLSMQILCVDHRRVPNLVKPTWETVALSNPKENHDSDAPIVERLPVCQFGPVGFQKGGDILTVDYGVLNEHIREATCNVYRAQDRSIRELCRAWY